MNLPSKEAYMALVEIQQDKQDLPNMRDGYYEKVYDRFKWGQKFTWNWSAAIFGFFWMIYRKMYLQSILYSTTATLSYQLLNKIFSTGTISETSNPTIFLFILIFFFIFGLTGNLIYLNHINKKVKENNHLVAREIKNTSVSVVIFTLIAGVSIISAFVWLIFSKIGLSFFEKTLDIFQLEGIGLYIIINFVLNCIVPLTAYFIERRKIAQALAERSQTLPTPSL